ncbi:caspase family protein [Prevotella sp. PCHR]|uniref:Caspase family protein n=1 Tax=Xylanibacter caecicola TaxID=2736294 RepID=A0ABX2B4C1_9BACT|nr:caspase family protein [Xylanibacter caecicola]NPE26337.1 caspase family protein [Xylanibacter caecicola]
MRKALLIGINNYPGELRLSGCIEDIHCLKSAIERHGNGEKNFGVKMLEDVQTSDEVLQNIIELFHDDAEVALLYFSGHGYVNTTGAEIVTPYELKHSGMYYKGVQMKDIMEVVHNSKAKNKIIILDCCHSGQMGKFNITETGSVLDEGVSILTACREDESACEAGGHGLFTELLCSALQGGAADFNGNITMGSIYAYIDRSFGEWEQRPVFKTNVSAFVSLKKVEPKVPLSVFRELPNLFSAANGVHKLDSSYEFTNSPEEQHKLVEPHAKPENVKKFKLLQQLQSIGLVEPVDAPFMYFAAMNGTGCKLTALGKHYWRLVKNNNI